MVDREEAGIAAEFGRHVRNDSTVTGRERGNAGPEELHETVREIDLPQALGDREGQIRGKHAFAEAAR